MKILTLARFYKEQSSTLDLEIPGNESTEWTEYIFDPKDVAVANKSTDGYSTIEIKGCDRQTVAIDWVEMKKLIGFDKEIINNKANYEYQEQ